MIDKNYQICYTITNGKKTFYSVSRIFALAVMKKYPDFYVASIKKRRDQTNVHYRN